MNWPQESIQRYSCYLARHCGGGLDNLQSGVILIMLSEII